MRLRTTLTLCALLLTAGSMMAQTTSTSMLGTCIVSDSNIIKFAWNSALNCDLEGDLSDLTELGFHSGYNGWAGSITFDDPYATVASRGSLAEDTLRWQVQVDDYYGYDASLITELNIVLNRGVSDPDPWSAAGRDTVIQDGPFGLGCADLLVIMSELNECPTPGPVDTGGTDTTSTGLQIVDLVNDLNIQPNPATDQFVLTFTNTDMIEMDFFLTDMTGRVVRQQNSLRTERVEVIRNDLAPGMYTAILRAADGRMSVRRVVLN